MGCCLSREDEPFDSANEALLLKGREKSVDADPQKKDSANGSYKSPSAIVAARDASSVPTKPQPVKKYVECVEVPELNDKAQSLVDKPVSSPIKPSPNPEPAVQALNHSEPVNELPDQPVVSDPSPCEPANEDTCPTKQTEVSHEKKTKTSPKASPKKPSESEDDELMASAFSVGSITTENGKNENDKTDNDECENENEVENEDTTNKPEGKPKKTTPTKKSKKKRKKGKK